MLKDKQACFGIKIPQTFPVRDADPSLISNFVGKAESLGYHSVWVSEVVFGAVPVVDPIPLLSYAAATSNRLKLGTAVMVSALLNPVNFAKNVASLDQLSKGRLIVGISIGSNGDIYSAFGLSREDRAHRFEEGIELAKKIWTEDSVTFQGRFWQLQDAPIAIKPLQKPYPPLWFGGSSDPALRRAVRMGNGWMGAGTRSTSAYREGVNRIGQYLAEEGRDAAKFHLAKHVYVAVDRNKKRAYRRLREWFQSLYAPFPGVAEMALQGSIYGTEQECVDQLGEIVSLGTNMIILDPVYDMMEQMECLARDVLPKL